METAYVLVQCKIAHEMEDTKSIIRILILLKRLKVHLGIMIFLLK